MRALRGPGEFGPARQSATEPDEHDDPGSRADAGDDAQLGLSASSWTHETVRLELIRPIAGGVSHEFNNILNVIQAFGQGLLSELRSDARGANALQEMLRAAERGSELTYQLLAFSQLLFLQPRVFDLNELARSAAAMARSIAPASIEVALEVGAEPCFCKLDRRQLERTLANLLAYCCSEPSQAGTLTIRTSQPSVPEHGENGVPEGRYVMLSVADTATRLSAEVVAHLFEPFYSSKQLGRGCGLGLAAVYGGVRQCGGWITVNRAAGDGNVFELYFPLESE